MFSCKRATIAVAAQLLVAVSSIVRADPSAVPAELIENLHDWIDIATDLPPAGLPATVVFVDTHELNIPAGMTAVIGTVPRGLYTPDTGTITLVRPWSPEDPQDIAILLHELVHHRQGGKHFYCQAAKEHAAYNAQKKWLAEQGLSLNVNWIAVVLASSCTPRDIHP